MHRRQFLKTAALTAMAPGFMRAGSALAATSNESVIVLDSGGASITLVDQATREVKRSFPVGKEPHHLMLLPDGQQLIVADAVGGELNFLNPITGAYEGKLPGIEDPYQIGFSPDRKWFVANCLRLNRVDIYHYDGGHKLQLAKRVPLDTIPSHMAFTADSQTVFVSLQGSDAVAALHLPTQRVLWTMRIGKATAGVWMTPHDEHLLVALTGEDAVIAVDWRRQRIVRRIVTGRAAHNFRSLADHRHVMVSNRLSNTISVLDMQDLRKVEDIRGLRPGPDDMELSADRRWLWTTFRFAREVGVIDMRTRKLVDVIHVGRSPHGIYFHDRAPFYDNLPYAAQRPLPVRSA
jgi:DNA-binding beta-propeller fold protein YncE